LSEEVIVQFPVKGKSFSVTEPVVTSHVGCVIDPTDGSEGVVGAELITASADIEDVHEPSDTVNVYVVPGVKLGITVVEPDPVYVAPSGYDVTVQLGAFNPSSVTSPVETVHEGCVTDVIIGISHWALTTELNIRA